MNKKNIANTNMAITESVVSMPEIVRRPPPLGLYVHLPWCARKCPYCDFNSHKSPSAIPENDYIAALLADAESLPPLIWGRRVQTIFIGGGTPSLFSPMAIDKLLCGLRALFILSPDAEITLEANPGSSESAKFADFAAAGINRLSLGVQSFNDKSLTALGRIHDGKAAHLAAAAAAKHFRNFNIDLMHALPSQNMAAACADVAAALQYKPPHLSLYQLTLEVGTPFYRSPPPQLPSADSVADIGDAVAAAAAGFERYEISAFAKDGQYCRHNLNYWQFGDYAGIGAGAHGKITISGKIHRYVRIKHPAEYMRRAATNAVAEEHIVSGRDAAFEFMLNVLRLPAGFAPAMLEERTGIGVLALDNILTAAEEDGLLCIERDNIKPTEKGLRYLNDLLLRFLPDEKEQVVKFV